MMESHNTTNKIEFTWKKEKGFIIFDHREIIIPENLSSVICGDLSELLTENRVTKENDLYIFEIGQEIKLKLKTKIRINREKQRYSIEFGVGIGFFSRPILKFKNLTHEKYQQILHILEAHAIFSKAYMEEFIEFANDMIYTGNSFRYAIWGLISGFTLLSGLVLLEFLNEKNTIVILLYYILDGVYLFYNMVFLTVLGLRYKDSPNPDKQRKIHITQKIARNLYLIFITFVYLFVYLTTR